jgi:hypothetical protein
MAEVKEAITEAQEKKARWEAETLQKVLEKTEERKKSFEGVSLEPVERLYTEARFSRRISIQTRDSPDRLSRKALDNAPVRRIFFARRNQ